MRIYLRFALMSGLFSLVAISGCSTPSPGSGGSVNDNGGDANANEVVDGNSNNNGDQYVVYNYDESQPTCDGVPLAWFDSTDALRASAPSEAYARTREDEAKFLEPGQLSFVIAREREISL